MNKRNEYEIVQHTAMNHLEMFLIELTSRNPHGHSDLEIGILLDGQIDLILENQKIPLYQNDIYVINHYQIHSFLHTGHHNTILAFQINAEFYKHLSSRMRGIQFRNIIRIGQPSYDNLYFPLFDCAKAYFFEEKYFELKCASLLFQILHTLTLNEHTGILSEKEQDAVRNGTLRLNRITDYIAEHYTERITLEDISKLENITTYHASHFIRKMMGISFQDYLNNLRFEHAYQLISQTSLTILDICLESGFSSSRYLNQMFQKRLGCTALECRKQKRKTPLPAPKLPTDNIQKRLTYEAAKKILSGHHPP